MKPVHTHASHPAILERLRRAGGHLQGTIEVIERGRSCMGIAQQLQAVEKAIQQARKALTQHHLDHGLEDLLGPLARGQRHAMDEFREITRCL